MKQLVCIPRKISEMALALFFSAAAACAPGPDKTAAPVPSVSPGPGSGGGGSGGGAGGGQSGGATNLDDGFSTAASTSRFLAQATFGATRSDIDQLTGTSAAAWMESEFAKPTTLNLPYVLNRLAQPGARRADGSYTFEAANSPSDSFLINAATADDQLRQRMALALSEILVISHRESDMLFTFPRSVAAYMDVLASNAFGNYRELLRDVTYSPAMAHYLTYLQNERGDPTSGRVPDENYARELMQLFTIGLINLHPNGEPALDAGGQAVETYQNADIQGLARVFTGLSYDDPNFYFDYATLDESDYYSSLAVFPAYHSTLEKSFLRQTIGANTPGHQSIAQALDILVNHPNTPPFVSRQLIQRFVTSNPSPEYVQRVGTAFSDGLFQLPNGTLVGDGRRGDLSATIAAILMDSEARSAMVQSQVDFGKLREPIIRFLQWVRSFNAQPVRPEDTPQLFNAGRPSDLAQHPFKAPSVFNFFRPGYVAPGTQTGAAGLTMPEFQITNANSIAGYINFMSAFVTETAGTTFMPDYSTELALADDSAALIDHLNLVLASGALSESSRQSIVDAIANLPLSTGSATESDERRARVHLGILMVLTSPDYIVQK